MTTYCHCACGEPTTIARTTCLRQGRVKGQPNRYLPGHAGRKVKTPIYFHKGAGRWYVRIRARAGASMPWYRVVMWNELGRELRRDELVHHINGDKTDDRPENLEVLTAAEHIRLHKERGDVHILTAEDGRKGRAAVLRARAQARQERSAMATDMQAEFRLELAA